MMIPQKYIALTIICSFGGLLFFLGLFFTYASPKKAMPGEVVVSMGNDHVSELTTSHAPYNSIPPTSGPHLPRISPWGIAAVQVPDELQVKNLEDGGVIVHYDPLRVQAQHINELKKIVAQYPEYVLMEPYVKPSLPSPIVLTAWTRILKLENVDEGLIQDFIRAYKGIDHQKEKSG